MLLLELSNLLFVLLFFSFYALLKNIIRHAVPFVKHFVVQCAIIFI